MPVVTEQFVKHAVALAKSVKQQTEKTAAAAQLVKASQAQIEMVADTLIEQGLIPANQKSAAISTLSDPAEALQILNKTAQMVRAESMGEPVKQASAAFGGDGEVVRESDRKLLAALGF